MKRLIACIALALMLGCSVSERSTRGTDSTKTQSTDDNRTESTITIVILGIVVFLAVSGGIKAK